MFISTKYDTQIYLLFLYCIITKQTKQVTYRTELLTYCTNNGFIGLFPLKMNDNEICNFRK